MTRKDWVLLFALSLLWGASFLFIRVAVHEIPPLTLVFGRVAIAAVALGAMLAATGSEFPRSASVWLALAIMGFLNNIIPFTLIFWGEQHIGAGLASIFNATTPLFTVLAAHALTDDEKLTPMKLVGVALGIAGVAAMIGPSAFADMNNAVWAQAACVGAALSYGVANIYGRRFKRMGTPPKQIAFGALATSAVMILPVAAVIDRPWTGPAPGSEAVAALLGLALLSTALAYLIFYRVLDSAGATAISLVTFLIPPSAVLLGAAFLGESLEPRHIAGLIFIGAGLACFDPRLARLVAPRMTNSQSP